MNLVIVESPTKARTLSRFLGSDYSVEATMGHIKDLPKSELAVDITNNFKPQYEIVEKKRDVIEKLKVKSQKSKVIYLATDPDREGEAIAQHVEDVLRSNSQLTTLPAQAGHNSQLLRIVFHEITQSAVEDALRHPQGVDGNLVNAQIARRVLDRLVGYKLSPLLWKKVRRGLSAGRVQSVAVRLIVEKEREIEAFKSEEYWEIFAKLKIQNEKLKIKELVVKLIKINDKKAEVKDEKSAKEIVSELERADYKVADVRKREIKKSPYPPFTTSTMTQTASRVFGWSAKRTMILAQRLYEEGLITYHRTDSVNLASTALVKVREYIEKSYGKNYLPPSSRFFKKTSKLAQEAHEAIRPTDVGISNFQFPISNELTQIHQRLYDLIWKRFVACQMANCIFDETVIDVEAKSKITNHQSLTSVAGQAPLITNHYLLRASGQVLKFDGWRKVIPLSKEEEPELPLLEKDEALDLIKVLHEQKFTQPPSRFNEASLIKTLEKLGIGRPSTYAPIITTIQARLYVEKLEGTFRPTPVGVAVSDFLVKNFAGVVDYSFTAAMEDDLDNIAKGQREWVSMMRDFYTPFEKKLLDVEENSKRVKIEVEKLGKKCPTCERQGRVGEKQGELVIRVGRFGKFVSCSKFPECKHTEKYIEKLGMKCPSCKKGEVIIKSTKTGKRFYGCSRYPECKWASWRKPTDSKSVGQ